MIRLIDVVMNPNAVNSIGRLGENEHRRMLFDITEYQAMYPDAVYNLLNRLPGTDTAYPVATTEIVGGNLAWTVTSADVTTEGHGQCELVVLNGNVVAKSVVYLTKVLEALDGSGEAPEPWDEWQTVFAELKADAVAAAQDAEAASQAVQDMGAEAQTLAPGASAAVTKSVDPDTGAVTLTFGIPEGEQGQTGATGNGIASITLNADYTLTITYTNGQSYTTSSIRGAQGAQGDPGQPGQDGQDGAPGQDGYSPTVTVTDITGGHRVTITDATGAHSFDVMDGEGGVTDVQVAGSSVLSQGVANIPAATTSAYGVVQIGYGLRTVDNRLSVNPAGSTDIKGGTSQMLPITPQRQQESVYFGLSKAAGVDLANEEVTVGTYPATAKAAIKMMLGVTDPAVSDVQVNGTSVVSNGVANVPIMSAFAPGVAKFDNSLGTSISSGGAVIIYASTPELVKAGANGFRPIVPSTQGYAAFYGLAKAAGADMKNIASTTVGVYPEAQKSAISQMLNGSVSVTGSTPSITALPGIRYVCGEVTTLDITLPASGIVDIIFESGSTPTVLTATGVTWPDWFDPTALEANRTYEVNIADGFGAVMSWA